MSRPTAVIIEGPDGAGKSTLAEQLSGALGLGTVHLGPPPEGTSATAQCLTVLSSARDSGFVADRFHLGERVYGPLHRGVDTLGTGGQRTVEAALRSAFRVLLVVCLPPWPVVQENWRRTREGQMVQDESKMLEIYERYLHLGSGPAASQLTVMRYDYTASSVAQVVARLEAL